MAAVRRVLAGWSKAWHWHGQVRRMEERAILITRRGLLARWMKACKDKLFRKVRLKRVLGIFEKALVAGRRTMLHRWRMRVRQAQNEERMVASFQERRGNVKRYYGLWRSAYASAIWRKLGECRKEKEKETRSRSTLEREKRGMEGRAERLEVELDTTAAQYREMGLRCAN